MSASNRSGLQCLEHPNQQITNFCLHFDCLKPLCPDCVEIHTKFHSTQQIQSWKHCINKSAKNAKSTLQMLRNLCQQQNKYRPYKNVDTVEGQNIKKLHLIKDKIHRLVDEVFFSHQQQLRLMIRNQYKVDMPDTTKLKLAIQEMEKLLMKLGHSGTVLAALKKSLLLDHNSLLNYFGDLRHKEYKPMNETFVFQNHDLYPSVRMALEHALSLQKAKQHIALNQHHSTPIYNKNSSFESEQNRNPFESLKIATRNYFNSPTKFKLLHFFIPSSNELKVLDIESAQKGNLAWKSLLFSGKAELPCYFKSIITPDGDIYLTGGSQQDHRCRQIYHYNYEKNALELVAKMAHERSSHSISYANGMIYLIGGFSNVEGDVTRSCEVFNPRDKTCVEIAPLNTPSANSCTASFNDEYIFKFGGVENKVQGNSLIEMYSIKKNKWVVVEIEKDRLVPQLQLLSFSAAVQINQTEIMVFGGYDNSDMERPQRLCYALQINVNKGSVKIKNYNTTPLTYAEGFWNNNPIVIDGAIIALQNITDQQDELTAIADERRVIAFDGDRWL